MKMEMMCRRGSLADSVFLPALVKVILTASQAAMSAISYSRSFSHRTEALGSHCEVFSVCIVTLRWM